MENDPDIEYVEPNYIATATFVPNDQYYHRQWNFPKIQMEGAWDISTGAGVTIAVIDSGVAYEDHLSYRRARGNISKSASISLEVVITTRTSIIVTFETVPADRGRIIFADHTYRDGDAISKAAGSYVIGGTPGADYQFAKWETSGSISVADVNSPSTMCTVSGNGILRMKQSSLSPTPSPSQTPPPGLSCLIVTALHGSPLQSEVQFLRHFRDETLVKIAGQTFRDNLNGWYYSFSPQVSEFIRQNQWTRPPIILLIFQTVSILHLADDMSARARYLSISPCPSVRASQFDPLEQAILLCVSLGEHTQLLSFSSSYPLVNTPLHEA
jgi:hypothetical protein